jgi:hypothetical protein
MLYFWVVEAPVVIRHADDVVLVQNPSNLDFEKHESFRAQSADAVEGPNGYMNMVSRADLVHHAV